MGSVAASMRLTPRLQGSGERLNLKLSIEDMRKIGRAGRWSATVTDTGTGKRYRIRGASCGLGCHCDAIAVELSDTRGGIGL